MLPHLTQTKPAHWVYRPSEPSPVPFQGVPVFQKPKAGPKLPLFAGSPPEKQSFWQTISTYAQQFWRFVKSAFSKVFSAFSRNTPAKQKSSQPSVTQQPQPPTAELQPQNNDKQKANSSHSLSTTQSEDTNVEVIRQSTATDEHELAEQPPIQEVSIPSRPAKKIAKRQDRRSAPSKENATSSPNIAQDAMLVEELQMKEVMRRSIETSNTEADNRQNTSSTTPPNTTDIHDSAKQIQESNDHELAKQIQSDEDHKFAHIIVDGELAKQLAGLGSYTTQTVSGARKQPAQPASGSAVSNLPVGPLRTQDLFGNDLKSIRFKQSLSSHTCYLLAALNSIFQHPQGQRILDLIQINRTRNGYNVKFPGHPHPITVLDSQLGHGWQVASETPGVGILEQAYLNIGFDHMAFGTTHDALVRMLGENHVLSVESTYNALIEVFGEAPVESTQVSAQDLPSAKPNLFVPILTGVERRQTGVCDHYYSITPNPENPDLFNVSNPYDTDKEKARVLTQDQLNTEFASEYNLIRLDPPLKN